MSKFGFFFDMSEKHVDAVDISAASCRFHPDRANRAPTAPIASRTLSTIADGRP